MQPTGAILRTVHLKSAAISVPSRPSLPLRAVTFRASKNWEENDRKTGESTRDTMDSYGEAYATRSEEEGFGGIYGSDQDVPEKKGEGGEPEKPTTHPDDEFDESQGEEVKEKEKGRNQT